MTNNYLLLGSRSVNHSEQNLGWFKTIDEAKDHFSNTLLMFTKKASGRIVDLNNHTIMIYASYLQADGVTWEWQWKPTRLHVFK